MCMANVRRFLFVSVASAATKIVAGAPDCPVNRVVRECSGPPHGWNFVERAQNNGYNKHVRPPCGNDTHVGPTIVEVQLRLTHLSLVDVKRGRATIQGYLRSWWHDVRLAFNGTDEGGCFDSIDLMETDSDVIWKPDLYIDNLAGGDDYTELTSSKLAQILPDGSIWYSRQVLLTVDCKVNLRYLPYDSHTCGLTLASYSQGVQHIRLVPRGGVLGYGYSGEGLVATDFSGSVWNAAEDFKANNLISPGLVELVSGWDYATLSWDFERASGYYESAFILPAQFILLLSYMQFYIDRAATPARAGFATMPVLIMLSLTQMLYRSLPQGAQRMWLADFLVAIMILCVFEALEFGIVQTFQVRERNRAAALQGLKKVKGVALRLIEEAREKRITLIELLEHYKPIEVGLQPEVLRKEARERRETLRREATLGFGDGQGSSSLGRFTMRLGSSQPLPGQVDAEEPLAGDVEAAAPIAEREDACGKAEPQSVCTRLKRSPDAERNGVREADLTCILNARRVYEVYSRLDPKDNTTTMNAAEFRWSLTQFDIYISMGQARRMMGMFLRDKGKTTDPDMRNEALRFMEFTELLLQIDDYVLNLKGAMYRWWEVEAIFQTMSPSCCVDVLARFVFIFAIIVLDASFFIALSFR